MKVHNPSTHPVEATDLEPELDALDELDPDRFHFVSIEEGRELLDQQARKYLNMSGEEFRRKYRAGEFEDYCQSDVGRLSFLLPFAEFPVNDDEEHSR